MGIEAGSRKVQHKAVQYKISKAKQKAHSIVSQVAHKQKMLQEILKRQKDQAAEGETYSAGAF